MRTKRLFSCMYTNNPSLHLMYLLPVWVILRLRLSWQLLFSLHFSSSSSSSSSPSTFSLHLFLFCTLVSLYFFLQLICLYCSIALSSFTHPSWEKGRSVTDIQAYSILLTLLWLASPFRFLRHLSNNPQVAPPLHREPLMWELFCPFSAP